MQAFCKKSPILGNHIYGSESSGGLTPTSSASSGEVLSERTGTK